MFDFFIQKKDREMQSYLDLIAIDIKKMKLSKLAIEKAVGMIAKAVAKSEFIVQRKDGRVKDHIYWILNIRPNPNESATDFWIQVIRKLLIETECVICFIGEHLYIADAFTSNDRVMLPQTYKNIVLTANGNRIGIDMVLTANEIIHLRAGNEKIKMYLEKVLSLYDSIVDAMAAAKKISSTPKFSLDMGMNTMPVIRIKGTDGKDIPLTIDEYKENIKELLESEAIEVLTNTNGLKIEQMKIDLEVTSEDLVKLAKEIFTECAFAFDIPKAVFLGEITEKADSTNEFITYAVNWIVEVLNDSLNAKLVGEDDYLKGERIWIDMSRYKHVDIIESATNLDKLRGIGFNLDEIREMVGWEALNTEFSRERVITKNYTDELGDEQKSEKKDT